MSAEAELGQSLLGNNEGQPVIRKRRNSVAIAQPSTTTALPDGHRSEDYTESTDAESQKQMCLDCKMSVSKETGMKAQIYLFLEGTTPMGAWFEAFILLLIVVNVATFIIGTEEAIMNDQARHAFDVIEWVSVLIFTIEYIGRFYSCTEAPGTQTHWDYLTSFFSIVDLLAIVPFYIDLITPGKIGATTVVRIFRLFRLFKAEHYVEAFTVFDNVYRRNKGLLKTTGFVAFGLWIIMSVLFYYSEKDNPNMDGAFQNIPDAMFYVAIFFGGEWCRMDFFWTGKILGVFMIVFGIALYAIPIGILSEGFEAIASERKERAAKRAGTKVVCMRCGNDIKYFPRSRADDNDGE